jgi:SNF2 family DNA or RNA helicase
MQNYRWEAVVLDESTHIKNPKAAVTKFAMRLGTNIPCCKALLSGLPDPEGPLDLFEQFHFLLGGWMGFENFWRFRNALFVQPPWAWDWQPKTGVLSRLKEALRKDAFVLRRHEVGLANERIYEQRVVAMNSEQRKLQKQALDRFEWGEKTTTNWRVVVEMWLSRLAGGAGPEGVVSDAKVQELRSLLEGDLKGQQVVVWFRFNEELQRVGSALRKRRVSCAAIVGATSAESRRIRCQAFQDGKLRVLLMQVKCGRFGIDLSAASAAVYFSSTYSLEDRKQSEDRILHPSKREPLLFLDLVTEDSVDEALLEALRDKNVTALALLKERVWTAMRKKGSVACPK